MDGYTHAHPLEKGSRSAGTSKEMCALCDGTTHSQSHMQAQLHNYTHAHTHTHTLSLSLSLSHDQAQMEDTPTQSHKHKQHTTTHTRTHAHTRQYQHQRTRHCSLSHATTEWLMISAKPEEDSVICKRCFSSSSQCLQALNGEGLKPQEYSSRHAATHRS
jgi:hypothetical protein